MMKVSVLILTKNEEQDLPGCLESLAWCDDIVVFDSVSTDRTAEVALAAGARVVERPFDNWSAHQNWALQNIEFKHPWIYYSDADERVPPALAAEIQRVVADPGEAVAYRLPRRDYFMGKWLKHCIPSPFNIRLFRQDSMRYERIINPVPIPSGPVGELKNHFDHYPFSKGMSHWVAKHNAYSGLEAQQLLDDRSSDRRPSITALLREKDVNSKRRMQKELFYRLPARPLLKFLIFYFARAGFLDGRPGLTYCVLQSIYEYFIVLKTRELEGAPK